MNTITMPIGSPEGSTRPLILFYAKGSTERSSCTIRNNNLLISFQNSPFLNISTNFLRYNMEKLVKS